MESQDTHPRPRWPNIGPVKGSLWLAAAVLFWDVGMEGCYIFAMLICPLWLLVTFFKNTVWDPGREIAIARISLPVLTLAIAVANGEVQWKVSDANARRVISACEEFQSANGRYPQKLEELVPAYLPSVPRAKYCHGGIFFYSNLGDHCSLWWTRYGFYRRIYNFKERRWSNLD